MNEPGWWWRRHELRPAMLDRLIDRFPLAGPIYTLGIRQWARAMAGVISDLFLRPSLELTERGRAATL